MTTAKEAYDAMPDQVLEWDWQDSEYRSGFTVAWNIQQQKIDIALAVLAEASRVLIGDELEIAVDDAITILRGEE